MKNLISACMWHAAEQICNIITIQIFIFEIFIRGLYIMECRRGVIIICLHFCKHEHETWHRYSNARTQKSTNQQLNSEQKWVKKPWAKKITCTHTNCTSWLVESNYIRMWKMWFAISVVCPLFLFWFKFRSFGSWVAARFFF